jgi:hypothetical protein
MLYDIEGRKFDNCWLKLFYYVASKDNPSKELLNQTYNFLLENLIIQDSEKLEQMEMMNEIRMIPEMNSGEWRYDEVTQWMNIHRKKLRSKETIQQTQIPRLFGINLETSDCSTIETEYEEIVTIPWIQEGWKESENEIKSVAIRIKEDSISSNAQSLMKNLKRCDIIMKRFLSQLKSQLIMRSK